MTRVKARTAARNVRVSQLDKAVRAWERRQYTNLARCVAAMGVPYSSLYARVRHKRKPAGEAHEGQMLFSLAEEKAIVRWIVELDDKGFPARVSMIRELAQQLLVKRDSPHQLGQHFIHRFLNRHPMLTTKFSTQVHRQRALASNLQHLRLHFDRLKRVIRKRNIAQEQIYNMDEKGILMGVANRVKVICRRGRRNPALIHGKLFEYFLYLY